MTKITHNNITLNLVRNPVEKDVAILSQEISLDPAVVAELTHPTFHPKIESYGSHALLIVHFPQFKHGSLSQLKPSELDFIFTPSQLTIVQYSQLDELDKLVEELEMDQSKKEEFFQKNTGFLMSGILNHLFCSFFQYTDRIGYRVNEIENRIFRGQEEKVVSEISLLRRQAIDFKRILWPNLKIFEELKENPALSAPLNLKSYLNQLYFVNRRLVNFVESQIETLQVLHETNVSLLSNKISSVMKVLTMFSVIVFPLTLFASIWGMNMENMPLMGHAYDFWIIIGLMGLGTFFMLLIFKIKRWL